jgi:hypothetical protein
MSDHLFVRVQRRRQPDIFGRGQGNIVSEGWPGYDSRIPPDAWGCANCGFWAESYEEEIPTCNPNEKSFVT